MFQLGSTYVAPILTKIKIDAVGCPKKNPQIWLLWFEDQAARKLILENGKMQCREASGKTCLQ